MARIALLNPGAMGAAVGRTLREAGHEVGWLPDGRGSATTARAEAAGLEAWADLSGAEVVVSLVPPAAAVETAHRVTDAGFTGLYLDANAISPERAAQVAGIVRDGSAAYVDGGVVGPPPAQAGTTRLFLSGDEAERAAGLFVGTRLETVVVDADAAGEFGASALKMVYASWTKISAALLLAAHGTAEALGVADELRAEWGRSLPELVQRLQGARSTAAEKGWRWVDEMRQIAATFEAAGSPAGFGEAAAAVYERYPRA